MNHLLYIDPGTGSLFYQALLSGALTFIVFFGKVKTYIKTKISGDKHES